MVAPSVLRSEQPRLHSQLERLQMLCLRYPGQWWTLAESARNIGASEAGCSARWRDLRNTLGWAVEKRIRKSPGLWEYHGTPPGEPAQLSIL